jgi:hypothetical protein
VLPVCKLIERASHAARHLELQQLGEPRSARVQGHFAPQIRQGVAPALPLSKIIPTIDTKPSQISRFAITEQLVLHQYQQARGPADGTTGKIKGCLNCSLLVALRNFRVAPALTTMHLRDEAWYLHRAAHCSRRVSDAIDPLERSGWASLQSHYVKLARSSVRRARMPSFYEASPPLRAEDRSHG